MTLQSALTLLSVVTCLGVGGYVFVQNRRRLLNALWGNTNLFVAWWSFGNFFLLQSTTPSQALFWARLALFGASFIPSLWLHFCYQLTQTRLDRKILFWIYLLAFVNASLSWHPLLITGVTPRIGFPFFPEAGPLYLLHVVTFYLLIFPGLVRLWRSAARSKGYKKKRLGVILVASVIGFGIGETNYYASYHPNIPPIGSQWMFLYPLVITLAMYRYHIFGIHLADRSPSYYEKVKFASERIAQETDLSRLKETILDIITAQTHPIFCRLHFFSPQNKPGGNLFPLVQWFSYSRELLSRERLEFQITRSPGTSPFLENLYPAMNSLDVELCVPVFHHDQLIGIILLGEKRSGIYSQKDLSFLTTLSHDAAIAVRNAQLITQLQQNLNGIIDAFAASIDKMDPDYTYEHLMRTKGIARQIVKRLRQRGTDLKMPEELFLAGILLHDVGKLFTPREILHKNGPLTEEEWIVMRKHPRDGAEILKKVQGLEELSNIALYHQERWDGKGYPEGLKGSAIPLGAQVASVADAFDAMTSDRPYRKGVGRAKAIEELKKHAGTQFSPQIVQIMVELHQEELMQQS